MFGVVLKKLGCPTPSPLIARQFPSFRYLESKSSRNGLGEVKTMIFSPVSQGGVGRVIAGEEGSSRQCFDVLVVLRCTT